MGQEVSKKINGVEAYRFSKRGVPLGWWIVLATFAGFVVFFLE